MWMPPPVSAKLPLKVLLTICTLALPAEPSLQIPPPTRAALPLRVLLATRTLPAALKMPPAEPKKSVEFRLSVLLTICTVALPPTPLFQTPAPREAELPLRVLLPIWRLALPPTPTLFLENLVQKRRRDGAVPFLVLHGSNRL